MGFRNPITTATAVDTGHGLADPGVRLYEDTSIPASPQGIAEWRTGLMTRNATEILTGGGSGGSGFTIDGGRPSAAAIDAPLVGLNVESAPAGGYRSVGRLERASLWYMQGTLTAEPTDGSSRTYTPTTFATGWALWSSTDVYGQLAFTQLPDGLVLVDGVCQYNGGTGATNTVLTLPTGALRPPSKRQMLPGNLSDTAYRGVDIYPSGAVILRGAAPTAGNFLAVSGVYRGANF